MKQNFEEFFDDVKKQYGDQIIEESKRISDRRNEIIKSFFKSPAFLSVAGVYIVLLLMKIIPSWITAINKPGADAVGEKVGQVIFAIFAAIITSGVFIIHGAIICFIVGIIYYFIKSSKIKNELNNKYKYIVYSKMLGNFYEGLGLLNENEKQVFLKDYDWKSFYDDCFRIEAYNRSYVGDVFIAKRDNRVKLQGSELTLKYHTTDSKGNSHTRLVFQGLVCELFLDKSINGEVQVNRNKIKSASGFLGSRAVKEKYKNKIEMDSRDFEEKFEVFASNGVLAMQILTAEIMQDLIDLYGKTEFDFAVVNNKIYFRINAPELFELTSLFSNNVSSLENLKGKLKTNYEIIDNAFNIVNKVEGLINERF